MGAGNRQALPVIFDGRLKLEFYGSKVTCDAGLTPAVGKSRAGEVLETTLCLRSVENGAECERVQKPSLSGSGIQSRSQEKT